MYAKVVSVLSNSGTGTQDITFTPNGSDPSWTPKIAIVQWNRANTSADTFQEHMSYGKGFTDGTNQRCVSLASEDNSARGDTGRISNNAALISVQTHSGTLPGTDAIATFSSWLTNGMQINWSDSPGAQFLIHVLFLGGSDISNVTVGTVMSGNTTADIVESGLAYQPDFAYFLSGMLATEQSSTANAFISEGAATSSSAQWVQSVYTVDNPATMDTWQYYSHGKVVVSHTTAVDGYAVFSTFASNGFTLTVGDAFPANQFIYYLAIKGGSFTVGNNTEPGSVSQQTVTTNKDVKAVMVLGLDTGTADSTQAGHMFTAGMGTLSGNQGCDVWEDTDAVADSIVVSRHDTNQIYLNITSNVTATSSTLDDEAALLSVSSTNFILDWTNIGQARPYRYATFGTKAAEQFQRTISETAIAITSSLVPKSKRPLVQTLTNSDSIARRRIFGKSLSDTITNSDSITKLRDYFRSLSDTITNSDLISRKSKNSLIDSITNSDSMSRKSKNTITDTITNSDSITKLSDYFRSLSDSITNSDSVEGIKLIIRTVEDTIIDSDSITRTVDHIRNIADTISNSDSLVIKIKTTISDSISTTDSIIKKLKISITNTITNSDSIDRVFIPGGTPQQFFRSVSDTITNNEMLTKTKIFIRKIFE